MIRKIRKIVLYTFTGALVLTACDNNDDDKVVVTKVTVTPAVQNMEVGKTLQLEVSVEPEEVENKNVRWVSSDNTTATVDDNGLVSAQAIGPVSIFAISDDNENIRGKCDITVVSAPVPVTSITLNESELTLEEDGDTFVLEIVSIEPEGATEKTVTWASSDSEVATVERINSSSARVTTVTQGEVTISATAIDGSGVKGECFITVTEVDPGIAIELSRESVKLGVNATIKVAATFELQDNLPVLNWTTSNANFATASAIGELVINDDEVTATLTAEITAVGAGTATITAQFEGSRASASLTVDVLGDVPEKSIVLELDDDLKDAMENSDNSGKVIFLPVGYTYAWESSVRPTSNITVFGDANGDRPLFTITHNTPITLNNVEAEYIHFENLTFHSTHGDGYFINQGTGNADCNIGKLMFENCRFVDFGRSIVRTQAPNQRFELLHFNNCLIENCSSNAGQNYAFIQSTVAFEAFPDLRFTNTTVNHSYSTFITISGGTDQPSGKNLLLENVTFYKTVGYNTASESDRYLIEAGNNGPVNITVKNCILGSVRGVGRERGYRMNAESTMTATGNYATSDWTTTENTGANPPVLDIPATAYPGSAADLFIAPDNGDFHIKDAAFAGRGVAGDPRWW